MSEQTEQIADELVGVALRFGLTRQVAGDLSVAIVDKVMGSCGGGSVYLPKSNKTQRNKQIKADFTGTNHDEVCKKYDISTYSCL